MSGFLALNRRGSSYLRLEGQRALKLQKTHLMLDDRYPSVVQFAEGR
jgi:hypothetical protein